MKAENYQLLKRILREEGVEAVRNAMLSIYQELQQEQGGRQPQRLTKCGRHDLGGR